MWQWGGGSGHVRRATVIVGAGVVRVTIIVSGVSSVVVLGIVLGILLCLLLVTILLNDFLICLILHHDNSRAFGGLDDGSIR
ncbi:MAG: hypothetical protein LUG57_00455, partial [Oscillospiraceae bacterium]|nr:hypothetical protein [Oscillospiraceae bacterium]